MFIRLEISCTPGQDLKSKLVVVEGLKDINSRRDSFQTAELEFKLWHDARRDGSYMEPSKGKKEPKWKI
ncbi:hypothetical protein HanPSC8_Chr06g0242541 [Helianthus annuus]|nr:hypothetical protein HanPSC8_Chr06g0242541 [Helianthus annuus]